MQKNIEISHNFKPLYIHISQDQKNTLLNKKQTLLSEKDKTLKEVIK